MTSEKQLVVLRNLYLNGFITDQEYCSGGVNKRVACRLIGEHQQDMHNHVDREKRLSKPNRSFYGSSRFGPQWVQDHSR